MISEKARILQHVLTLERISGEVRAETYTFPPSVKNARLVGVFAFAWAIWSQIDREQEVMHTLLTTTLVEKQ